MVRKPNRVNVVSWHVKGRGTPGRGKATTLSRVSLQLLRSRDTVHVDLVTSGQMKGTRLLANWRILAVIDEH